MVAVIVVINFEKRRRTPIAETAALDTGAQIMAGKNEGDIVMIGGK